MPVAGGESFYAVIIICLILFFSLFACIGIHVIKKLRRKNREAAASIQNNNNNHDWQPLRSIVTPLETTDNQTLQAVASKFV
jgi:predicted PurR-regulated permease PerM